MPRGPLMAWPSHLLVAVRSWSADALAQSTARWPPVRLGVLQAPERAALAVPVAAAVAAVEVGAVRLRTESASCERVPCGWHRRRGLEAAVGQS